MKRFLYILILLIIPSIVASQQQRIPPAPDAESQTLQYFFRGKWVPSLDAAEIGAENYTELLNLRYGPDVVGLEGVQGYDNINTTALTTYTKIRSAYQLLTDKTTESYVLVQAENSGETTSRIYANTTSIPSQGNFSSSIELDTSGNAYVEDSTGAGLGRFSKAPGGNVVYSNGVENLIWAGEEMRVGAFFVSDNGTEHLDETYFATHANWDVTGEVDDSGGNAAFTFAGGSLNGTLTQENADMAQTVTASITYYFAYTVDVTTAPDGDFALVITGGDGYIPNSDTSLDITDGRHIVSFTTHANAATGDFVITASETTATQGEFTIDNVRLFNLQATPTNPADYTEAVNNTLSTSGNTVTIAGETRGEFIVMTSRKIQAVYFDVSTANTESSNLVCEYWTSSAAWSQPSNQSDGTVSSGKSLAQDGWFTFDYASDASPYHFEGNYLYAYRFRLNGGSPVIKYVTVNAPMQSIVDLWDGVPRQPIQFQIWRNADSKFVDYTLEVNEYSFEELPFVAELDGLTSTDYIIVMADDRLSGIRFDFIAGYVNETAARTATVQYWDGDSYANVTEIDGTSLSTATMGQNGLLWWVPPSEALEVKKTQFGVTGYAYKITVNDLLSGTYDGTKMAAGGDIGLDVVTVVPAQKTIPPFKFTSTYKNRTFLCGYSPGKQGNRCDYSQTNSTEIWNGSNSSDGGIYSLYFGGSEELTAAKEVYNRYGSTVITLLTVFKENETYVLRGDSPEDFSISLVSSNIGCPAPLTLASVEVAFEVAEELRRNLLIWISDSGPYTFDGQVLGPITGVEKYFDPDDDDCINFDEIERARGWYDAQKREYNLLIPSGASQTTNNVWLVYDLIKKKWFHKDTGEASFPQIGFQVQDTYGTKYTYGGIDTGYLMRLEYGTSWDGTPIEQVVETGDFWPTGNVWDLTRIVKIKLMAKRIPEEHSITVQHYSDTDDSQGLSGIWQSWSGGQWTDWEGGKWVSAALPSINLYLDSSINRIARDTIRDNLFGWAHRFRFSIQTFETTKGFQPLAWGIIYRKENRYDE